MLRMQDGWCPLWYHRVWQLGLQSGAIGREWNFGEVGPSGDLQDIVGMPREDSSHKKIIVKGTNLVYASPSASGWRCEHLL
jgi:hypothetical protein